MWGRHRWANATGLAGGKAATTFSLWKRSPPAWGDEVCLCWGPGLSQLPESLSSSVLSTETVSLWGWLLLRLFSVCLSLLIKAFLSLLGLSHSSYTWHLWVFSSSLRPTVVSIVPEGGSWVGVVPRAYVCVCAHVNTCVCIWWGGDSLAARPPCAIGT